MPTLMLKNVRLAFPTIWEPKTVNGEGEPAYSASFLIDPKDPQVKTIEAAMREAAIAKWADKGEATLKSLKAADKVCLHDGNAKAQYAGFEGMLYVSSRSPAEKRPLILDRDRTVLVAADGRPYAGCYVNANLEIWAQANGYGKRINATLRGVQFVADGDSFGGGTPAGVDDFEDLSNQGGDLDEVA